MTHARTQIVSADSYSLRPRDAQEWIEEGRQMAAHEDEAVFGSINLKHAAEVRSQEMIVQGLKASGRVRLERRDELEKTLQAAGFDLGAHLRAVVQGRLDLAWACVLMGLNGVLAVFVLLGFGPWYLTLPLGLLVLITALPVEEFFEAYAEQTAFREAIFLTLAVLALGAQFWLGTMRGLFLAALAPTDVGPVTHTLTTAAHILRYSLGMLAVVSECLCGYKLHRARTQLYSATARVVHERDHHNRDLVRLHTTIKAAEVEPDIRRAYRQIGARQYLASRRQTPPTHDENRHLRRAITSAVILLLILGALFFLASNASAAPPAGDRTVVLLDLTKSTSTENFQANLRGLPGILSKLPAGQRIVVVGITDNFAHPRMLLDRTLPATAGYLGLELRAARERLIADWQGIGGTLKPTYLRTDVLGSLSLLAYLSDLRSTATHLIIFSDLRQSTGLNLETVPFIAVTDTLARLKRVNGIPALPHTQVFLLGVDPTGKSATYMASLKDFWLRFFAEAGAEVQVFSIGRELPEF